MTQQKNPQLPGHSSYARSFLSVPRLQIYGSVTEHALCVLDVSIDLPFVCADLSGLSANPQD